jgi:hypothetical protein
MRAQYSVHQSEPDSQLYCHALRCTNNKIILGYRLIHCVTGVLALQFIPAIRKDGCDQVWSSRLRLTGDDEINLFVDSVERRSGKLLKQTLIRPMIWSL